MINVVRELVRKYARAGILLDTNVLLLLLVGSFDRARIRRFKNTDAFYEEDYDLLATLVSRFERIVTTPNVLTETFNLLGQLGEPLRAAALTKAAEEMHGACLEEYIPSRDVMCRPEFARLALTDVGIGELARGKWLVVTADFPLFDYLTCIGVDVINFNHIRPLAWVRAEL